MWRWIRKQWPVLVVVALVLATGWLLLGPYRTVVAWGTVGEWLGGIGALVPAVLWFYERRDRKAAEAEAARLRQEERDRLRRSQVRMVNFAEIYEPHPDGPPKVRAWRVTNNSHAPIRYVSVCGIPYAHNPRQWSAVYVAPHGMGPLGPGDSRVFSYDRNQTEPLKDFYALLMDAEQVLWKLEENGSLTDLSAGAGDGTGTG